MSQTAQQVANEIGSKERRFFAMDENGEWFSYREKPSRPLLHQSIWTYFDEDTPPILVTEHFANIHPKPHWRDSLVEYRGKH